jgi:hypothetical protein
MRHNLFVIQTASPNFCETHFEELALIKRIASAIEIVGGNEMSK